jgi:SAM-dependent methyltransferase
VTLDAETRRDRYFAARERELSELIDPATGRVADHLVQAIGCPLCGSSRHRALFEKHGFTFVRCVDCRLVFVNPQLKADVALEQYRTAETNDLWFDVLTSPRQLELDAEKFGQILDLLEPFRGSGRLLDVGCSTGLFLHLAGECGWTGVGLELAPRALAHARECYGVDARNTTLAEAGFEQESFDAVALLSVLEHANKPRGLLTECARVLRPGGAVYVIVPNVESLACRVLHEHARTFDGRYHLVYFSPSTLGQLVQETGLEVRQTTTRVSSLDAVLEHAVYEEPYRGSDLSSDPLAARLREQTPDLERLIEELDLGYKLHLLATKPA